MFTIFSLFINETPFNDYFSDIRQIWKSAACLMSAALRPQPEVRNAIKLAPLVLRTTVEAPC